MTCVVDSLLGFLGGGSKWIEGLSLLVSFIVDVADCMYTVQA